MGIYGRHFLGKFKIVKKLHIHNIDNIVNIYVFSDCDKFFSRPWRLKIHISHIHTGERAFKCQIKGCGKSYVRNSHLRRHHENNHSKAAAQQKISTPENKFPCTHCQKLFSNKYSLKKHQKVIL